MLQLTVEGNIILTCYHKELLIFLFTLEKFVRFPITNIETKESEMREDQCAQPNPRNQGTNIDTFLKVLFIV